MTMNLVNDQTGRAVISFDEGEATVHSIHLKKQLKQYGIMIPGNKLVKYHQSPIFPLDELFSKALREIYIPRVLNTGYHWEEES